MLFAGDPVFELYARRAVKGLYKLRNKTTGKSRVTKLSAENSFLRRLLIILCFFPVDFVDTYANPVWYRYCTGICHSNVFFFTLKENLKTCNSCPARHTYGYLDLRTVILAAYFCQLYTYNNCDLGKNLVNIHG
jgi:hypothetical protein